MGLSPRVRGNHLPLIGVALPDGSIPACAGEPTRRAAPPGPARVYPRVCGGTWSLTAAPARIGGLSPRVRGNRGVHPHRARRLGSIPACAGEPPLSVHHGLLRRVYPRVCGGTLWPGPRAAGAAGLSPRVRGNPADLIGGTAEDGSIPACAGEPITLATSPIVTWVYPRVCGGTPSHGGRRLHCQGLSPRVRGNRPRRSTRRRSAGSIPACAGEPCRGAAASCAARVYPRVCGGTAAWNPVSTACKGLSPRVRGNRQVVGPRETRVGSIPACAGEPRPGIRSRRPAKVYPRVCGGTWVHDLTQVRVAGLSPRVRGNRDRRRGHRQRAGSIPACAGEPPRGWCRAGTSRVYPRVCGGTCSLDGWPPTAAGLSPRVRGNPGPLDAALAVLGSIPACAGEPSCRRRPGGSPRVYPRVCGGTSVCTSSAPLARGLSPRVRGNPLAGDGARRAVGSIPACAGEPPPPTLMTLMLRVYPRVCGGTAWTASVCISEMGLSPRVRGNRGARVPLPLTAGSIPACAGEPR